jgi:hypothetical protein
VTPELLMNDELYPLINLCARRRGTKSEVLRQLVLRSAPANWAQVSSWLHTNPNNRRRPREETLWVLLQIQKEMTGA